MKFGCFYIDKEGRVWALFPGGEWQLIVDIETEPGNHRLGKMDTLDKEGKDKMCQNKGRIKRWLH